MKVPVFESLFNKIADLQMHNTILQKVKQFLNVKMVNLEKIKLKKCQPPPTPP